MNGFQRLNFCHECITGRNQMHCGGFGLAQDLKGISNWSFNVKEETPKSGLVSLGRKLMPNFVWLRHEDKFSHGIPDLSVTGNRRTTWWEFKLANPDFKSEGIQELTMKRLNAGNYARYIIYEMNPLRVYIVSPDNLAHWKDGGHRCDDWNHAWVLKHIWEAHAVHF